MLTLVGQAPLLALTYDQVAMDTGWWNRNRDLVVAVVAFLGELLAYASITAYLVQRCRGERANLFHALWVGIKSLPRVIPVFFFLQMGLTVGLALLLAPGLLVLAAYFVAIPAAVTEGRWLSSFSRSEDLTRGNRWPVLGVGVVFLGLSVIRYLVASAQPVSVAHAPWQTVLVCFLIAPLQYSLPAICYIKLGVERSQIEAQRAAAVFT